MFSEVKRQRHRPVKRSKQQSQYERNLLESITYETKVEGKVEVAENGAIVSQPVNREEIDRVTQNQ